MSSYSKENILEENLKIKNKNSHHNEEILK